MPHRLRGKHDKDQTDFPDRTEEEKDCSGDQFQPGRDDPGNPVRAVFFEITPDVSGKKGAQKPDQIKIYGAEHIRMGKEKRKYC